MTTIKELDERLDAVLADPRRPVDGTRLIHTLREVVAERPDYVYIAPEGMAANRYVGSGCLYVHGTGEAATPGCGIGALLHRLGIPLDELRRHEGTGAGRLIYDLLNVTGPAANAACNLCDVFQDLQDRRFTWGYALNAAEAWAGTAQL